MRIEDSVVIVGWAVQTVERAARIIEESRRMREEREVQRASWRSSRILRPDTTRGQG